MLEIILVVLLIVVILAVVFGRGEGRFDLGLLQTILVIAVLVLGILWLLRELGVG